MKTEGCQKQNLKALHHLPLLHRQVIKPNCLGIFRSRFDLSQWEIPNRSKLKRNSESETGYYWIGQMDLSNMLSRSLRFKRQKCNYFASRISNCQTDKNNELHFTEKVMVVACCMLRYWKMQNQIEWHLCSLSSQGWSELSWKRAGWYLNTFVFCFIIKSLHNYYYL